MCQSDSSGSGNNYINAGNGGSINGQSCMSGIFKSHLVGGGKLPRLSNKKQWNMNFPNVYLPKPSISQMGSVSNDSNGSNASK